MLSIEYVIMIIVGGPGSILGAVLGATFITSLPEVVRFAQEGLRPCSRRWPFRT